MFTLIAFLTKKEIAIQIQNKIEFVKYEFEA